MKQLKYTFLAAATIMAFVACDNKFTNMEASGYVDHPTTIDASAISYDSLPGKIKLKWTKPATESYEYMKVSYANPASGKVCTSLVSKYVDSIIIDNTLRKYGEYTFKFQAFNALHESAGVTEIKAMSGRAVATLTVRKTKIELTEQQLSTDNQEPSEGPIKNLIDGDPNSFFHTRWSGQQKPMPQYIQIDFNEAHRDFAFWYKNRSGSQVGPSVLELQISTDGTTWEKILTIDEGLPSGSGVEYTSEAIRSPKDFSHLRLVVTKTYGDKNYFNLAELQVYDAEIIVNDPEA